MPLAIASKPITPWTATWTTKWLSKIADEIITISSINKQQLLWRKRLLLLSLQQQLLLPACNLTDTKSHLSNVVSLNSQKKISRRPFASLAYYVSDMPLTKYGKNLTRILQPSLSHHIRVDINRHLTFNKRHVHPPKNTTRFTPFFSVHHYLPAISG